MKTLNELFGLRPERNEPEYKRGELIAAGAIFAGVLLLALCAPALADLIIKI